ncbi:Protein of unknown function [Actinacidiphila alni]|uniref:DUF3152 domain-containing protein n=1 Tax=Actinacidiphila alni TaxID=380248 RepID=A0A1I2KXR5_9ACTN|nr:DUF3152 domain-containing protein [Actinacidiphila alni]SFF71099.1 Protein of unknown function [Actinacidiphila alni]
MAVTLIMVTAGVGLAAWQHGRNADSAAAIDHGLTASTGPAGDRNGAGADGTSDGKGDGKGSGDGSGDPAGTTPPASPSTPHRTPTATPTATPTTTHKAAPASVPVSGSGRFSTADANGKASGHGTIRRYKVEVEGGIDLSASDAAHEIADILADPRGWTADGHDGFQLVSSGRADFVVKIATPNTVDAICGAAGLLTRGEVNCDVGSTVVVNLKRWMLGSPEFTGPIEGYRALIINHEVGHRIGHGHEACPGPGRFAPVMMQQIKGLNGCKANEWPYDGRGRYVGGPHVA